MKNFIFITLTVISCSLSFAQLSITNLNTASEQNFNSLGGGPEVTLPTGFRASSTASGVSWNSTITATIQSAGTTGAGVLTGSSSGGFYNFGNGVNATSTERAIGFLTSTGYLGPRSIFFAFTNNTGSTVTEIDLSWAYEKYRSGTRAIDWTFFHGATATNVNTAATAGNQSYSVDANNTTIFNPPSSTSKSFTLTGLTITNGTTYYLRWAYTGVGGSTNAQGLGIDDFSITLKGAATCAAPSTQVSAINFSSVTSSSLSLNWTNGNGAGRVIIMNTANTFTAPTNGSNPSPNTTYTSGQQVVFNGTGSGPITIDGLAPGNTYHFRAYEYCSPDRTYQTATETNNPNSIAIVKAEPTNHPTAFACGTTTSTSIPLTWADATGATTPDGYLIRWSTTSFAAIPNPVDGTAQANGATTQNVAQGVQAFTAAGLSGSTTYFFKIWSYSNSGSQIDYKLVGEPQTSCTTLSNASDIIESSGFTYTSNINYLSNQAAGPFTNTTGNVGVFRFQVRDGGGSADADGLGTELNSITFNVGTTHINYMLNAGLFDGNTMRANNPSINVGAGTITFSGLSGTNFTAVDNGSLTLTLRVSFNNNVVDNQQLQFSISNAVASSLGSTFAAANAGGAQSSITGDRNRIEVTADRLAFATQPVDQSINVNLNTFTIAARDINGRTDLDATNSITLTTSGTGMSSSSPYTLTAGVVDISNVQFTTAQGAITLTATTTGLSINSVVSNNFNIADVATGSFRTMSACLWSSTGANNTGTWQVFSGGWQNLPFTGYPNTYPPTNSATAVMYIRHNVTLLGTNTTKNIIIEDGGYLNTSTITPTFKNVLVKNGGTFDKNPSNGLKFDSDGILEVEDGGTFIYKHTNTTSRSTNLWAGTEKFHPNSNFIVRETDNGSGNLVVENASDISLFEGAMFGNFIVDMGTLGGDVPLFVSGLNTKLTNGDFILRTGSDNGVIFNNGSYTVTIGDSLIVESTYNQPFTLTNSTSTVNFTVNGAVVHNGTGEFRLAHSQTNFNPSVTLNIDKDLTIGSTNFNFDIGSSSTGTNKSTVNLKGNLKSGTGNFLTTNSQAAKKGVLNFTGTTLQTVDVASTGASTENVRLDFNVKNGATVQLINRDFELGTSSKLTVETGGTLDFGFNGSTALNLSIANNMSSTAFESQQASTLKISSPEGITTTAGVGNVRVVPSNRTYNQTATFHYIGKVNQVTGNAVTTSSNGKVLICDLINNSTQLSLTNSTAMTNNTSVSATGGKLDIRKGQVIESETAFVSGSTGTLYMEPGTLYRVAKGSANATDAANDLIPRVAGGSFSYVLNGGTIELAGSGANAFQTIRGTQSRPNYKNLLFSGANTYGLDYKNLSTATAIDSSLRITGTSVVDCINSSSQAASFTGAGGLIMDGGTLRIKKTTDTNPELTGSALSYNITGGTIEFYGSGATQNQRLRGGNTYHNIVVNADAANLNFAGTLGNMSPASSITITGTMNVNAPATLRLDATNSISGSGNFAVNDGATLLYASPNGIKTTGTGTSDGHIRITGTRTFSPNASYGFISNQSMVTGDALPSEVVNLYMAKNVGTIATLSGNVEVKNQLMFSSGVLATGSNEVYVSNNAIGAVSGGENTGTDKFINGRLRRATSTGSGYNFPVGFTGYGAQGFTMNVTGSGQVLGYMETNNTTPLQAFVYCDVETITATGQQIGQGAPGADGFLDQIPLDLGSPMQWHITNPGGGITSYDISVFPNGINDITPVETSGGQSMRFLMKNGEPGNSGVPAGAVTGEFTQIGFFACPTGNTLTGLTGFSTFTMSGSSGSGSSLPIELLFFSATPNQRVVDLNWATASEMNNDYFTIERSKDGNTWDVLETVSGAGTTNQRSEYNTIDALPFAGISYYRLKQTDYDGSYSYSAIKSVYMTTDDVKLVKVINILGQEVDQNAKGLVILVFSNGASIKVINE